MSPKSVSLSVRLSPDDASTLAGLKVPDATTPSDKIRALIRAAAEGSAEDLRYGDYLGRNTNHLREKVTALRESEDAESVHSELVAYFANWLTESSAHFLAATPEAGEVADRKQLLDLERGVTERIVLLFEATLRFAVTGESPCYDRKVIIDRIGTITDLAKLLSEHSSKGEDENG